MGFLGPLGTFTEQALLSQPDLAAGELVPLPSMSAVLQAVAAGKVDVGFVAIENSIEGTVNLTQDGLIFNHDLLIQREVVIDVEQCLLGPPGTIAGRCEGRGVDPRRDGAVLAIPDARSSRTPRCAPPTPRPRRRSRWERTEVRGLAAIAPRIAAELYGLDVFWRPTSPTMTATRPASWWWRATASPPRPGTTRRLS